MEIPDDDLAQGLHIDDDGLPLDESIDVPLTDQQLVVLLEERIPSQPIKKQVQNLLDLTISSVKHIEKNDDHLNLLFNLLSKVIKPLFTAPHSAITPAGRKNEYQDTSIKLSSWLSSVQLEEKKLWKQEAIWSLPLLTWIVHQVDLYAQGQTEQNAKEFFNTLAELTPLLAPPILQLIDESEVSAKALGASLLERFCRGLIHGWSILPQLTSSKPVLARTGLGTVFLDALEPNLSLLPSLTPEKESTFVLRRVYPSYIAVINATYPSTSSPSQQTQHYTTLLSKILSSLTHIGDSHIPLQVLLLTHLHIQIQHLGLSIAPHLRQILPYCQQCLSNPFGALDANLPVLEVCVGICQEICTVVPERVRATWWTEILRGCTGCWLILEDHDTEVKDRKGNERKTNGKSNSKKIIEVLEEVEDSSSLKAEQHQREDLRSQLKDLVGMLRDIVDGEKHQGEDEGEKEEGTFLQAISLLQEEEEDLKGLFEGILPVPLSS